MENITLNNSLAKECIVTALVELMKVKDYSAITITDIANKSGMSRMTYYRNYKSKDDIIIQYVNDIAASVHELIAGSGVSNDNFAYFKILFENLGVLSDIAIVAYNAHMGDLILDAINENMLLTFPPSNDDNDKLFKRYYYAGAVYNVLIEWLRRGKKESVEHMATLMCEMMETPLSQL